MAKRHGGRKEPSGSLEQGECNVKMDSFFFFFFYNQGQTISLPYSSQKILCTFQSSLFTPVLFIDVRYYMLELERRYNVKCKHVC